MNGETEVLRMRIADIYCTELRNAESAAYLRLGFLDWVLTTVLQNKRIYLNVFVYERNN